MKKESITKESNSLTEEVSNQKDNIQDDIDIEKSKEQEEKQGLDELEWPSILDKKKESITTQSNSLTEVEKNNNKNANESISKSDDFDMPDL